MKSRVVGFGGGAESGKSTAAMLLTSIARPNQYEHIEFSDPIFITANEWLNELDDTSVDNPDTHIQILADVLGRSLDVPIPNPSRATAHLDDIYKRDILHHNKTHVTPENKKVHRPLLEWLGHTAIQLISPRVWGDIVNQKITTALSSGADLVTVGGVRSISDSYIIHNQDGHIIRLYRAGGSESLISESQLSDWVPDFEILNNGSLEHLRKELVNVWTQIALDQKAQTSC